MWFIFIFSLLYYIFGIHLVEEGITMRWVVSFNFFRQEGGGILRLGIYLSVIFMLIQSFPLLFTFCYKMCIMQMFYILWSHSSSTGKKLPASLSAFEEASKYFGDAITSTWATIFKSTIFFLCFEAQISRNQFPLISFLCMRVIRVVLRTEIKKLWFKLWFLFMYRH
mgnify:CR=1 FL=1